MGLLLSLIYINDLPNVTDNDAEVVIFTDYSTIIVINSKMYYLEFRTKNCIDTTLVIKYFNKSIANIQYTNFLGLLIDDTLTRDNHIDPLIFRLISTCYGIRTLKGMLSREALRIVRSSYLYSVIFYGIIVCGNTSNVIKIF